MLAYVTGERWVLPTARFHAFCRQRHIAPMRAMAFAQAAGTKIEKRIGGYLTFPIGLRKETAQWRRERDMLGEYMLLAVFNGLAWIEGVQRDKGTMMAYVVADQWRLPKEKRFWPPWAIEVARAKGEWITETPTEYILTVG